jgi:hypothetical protein
MNDADFKAPGGQTYRISIRSLMWLVILVAVLLTPLIWAYKSTLRERRMAELLHEEARASAAQAYEQQQRAQTEMQKVTIYSPDSASDRVNILKDNQRLKAEVRRLEQRIAELEGHEPGAN